jgi:thiol:disulfide interchange protein DsbD
VRIIRIVTYVVWALAAGSASGAVPFAGRTQADLFLQWATARPGDTVMAGVRLRMTEGWHTYWKNPGESGGATKIEWTLPPGVTAGEIRWPVPEKLVTEGIVTYIYHHEAVLLVPLQLAADVPAGTMLLQARVSFLECDALQCIPGKAQIAATLQTGETTVPSKDAALIAQAVTQLPRERKNGDAKARWDQPPAGEAPRPIVFEWTADASAADADFFPLPSPKFSLKDPNAKAVVAAGKIQLRKAVEKLEGDWPAEIAGLLIEKTADGKRLAAWQATFRSRPRPRPWPNLNHHRRPRRAPRRQPARRPQALPARSRSTCCSGSSEGCC